MTSEIVDVVEVEEDETVREFTIRVDGNTYTRMHPDDEWEKYTRPTERKRVHKWVGRKQDMPKTFTILAEGEVVVLSDSASRPQPSALSHARPVVINNACSKLKRDLPNDWTQQGLPKLERLAQLINDGEVVTRDEVKLYAGWCTQQGSQVSRALV